MEEHFSLIRDFATIMAVAGVAIVLFRWLRQPLILGYLLTGLVISPYNFPAFSTADIETIRLLADLGLVILLFALGLEFGWQRIRQLGFGVILIGAIEISVLMAIGFEIGLLLGWTVNEAIFLGAALCISSSAVLVKVLRDEHQLHSPFGRLIVGILVIEDFAAVVLLSVLSAIATTGATDLAAVGWVVGKLSVFSITALVLGGLLAPRVIRYVSAFRSSEVLLITGLALCFGLARIAHELGISAAAGAFLIGTVLGDTRESEQIGHTMSPIRDMFAAIFFVSIGMLIDLSIVVRYLVPGLIVTAAFILGKVVADTLATFVAGHDPRTALKVGMGMPQLGEFSLAMIKVGVDHHAIGAFLYPVIGIVTGITAFLYPFIFRLSDRLAVVLSRRSPGGLKRYVENLSLWLATLREGLAVRGERGRAIQHQGRVVLVNAGVIMVLLVLGALAMQFSIELATSLGLRGDYAALVLGSAVVVFCIPSAVAIWRALRALTEHLYHTVLGAVGSPSVQELRGIHAIVRESMQIVLLAMFMIWSLPFLSQWLFIGNFSAPLPILILVGLVVVLGRMAYRIHGVLEATVRRTFLGRDSSGQAKADQSPEA